MLIVFVAGLLAANVAIIATDEASAVESQYCNIELWTPGPVTLGPDDGMTLRGFTATEATITTIGWDQTIAPVTGTISVPLEVPMVNGEYSVNVVAGECSQTVIITRVGVISGDDGGVTTTPPATDPGTGGGNATQQTTTTHVTTTTSAVQQVPQPTPTKLANTGVEMMIPVGGLSLIGSGAGMLGFYRLRRKLRK